MEMKKKLIKYPFLTKEVEVYTLENGHTIVLAHKEGGLVNVSSWVKTGSINEDNNNNGISHFLEHLMFKGTSKHKEYEQIPITAKDPEAGKVIDDFNFYKNGSELITGADLIKFKQ